MFALSALDDGCEHCADRFPPFHECVSRMGKEVKGAERLAGMLGDAQPANHVALDAGVSIVQRR